MARNSSETVLRTIRALFSEGTVGALTDIQLLERFTSRDAESADLAFASLVERHGPMVLHVCQAVLRDFHEAEDAFQATFVILALKAGSIRGRQSLTAWLYSVAYNVAATARSSAVRRRAHEWKAGKARSFAFLEDAKDDLEPVINEELDRIPERYRAVLVLCCLKGLTQHQAAQQLGWPVGTVQSRLARGRQRLRARLARRGLDPSAAVMLLPLSSGATRVALPPALAYSTVRIALSIGAARALEIGVVPIAVMRLAKGVVGAMLLNKVLTMGVAALLVAGLIASGAAVYAYQSTPVPHSEPAKIDPIPRAVGDAKPAYEKAAESLEFRSERGSQVVNIARQRAVGLSGIVLLPDDQPSDGTEVAVATRENPVFLQSGRFGRNVKIPRITTGADGRFTFPPRDDKFTVIAVSEAGYAEASSDELAESGKLVLQPWGQIEGGVRIGPRQGVDQPVMFVPLGPEGRPGSVVAWRYETRTDERGRFHFDRVLPGRGLISRVVVTKFAGGSSRRTPCWQELIVVKQSQTARVTVGGKGRPVVGRIVVDGIPESPVDWTHNEPVTVTARPGLRFASNVEKDGRFRIDDLPPGRHTLEVSVNGPPDAEFVGPGKLIGRVKMTCIMPEAPGGQSKEPLDLGTIKVKLDPLRVGDLAPDFDIPRITAPGKSQRLKLSDYRGKLVLLNFWDSSDEPSEMTVLKEVEEKFGRDPRFVLISIACDNLAAPSEEWLSRNGLNWTHGFGGSFLSGVVSRYKIRAIPHAYVMGPDRGTRSYGD
jgi:RNA polymerase sigma factor (sigma-70 family)